MLNLMLKLLIRKRTSTYILLNVFLKFSHEMIPLPVNLLHPKVDVAEEVFSRIPYWMVRIDRVAITIGGNWVLVRFIKILLIVFVVHILELSVNKGISDPARMVRATNY